MKIIRMEARTIRLRMIEPFIIAYETYEFADNVFLRVETDHGIVGHGCSAPDKAVTGEDAETVMTAFGKIIEPALLGMDPLRYTRCLEEIRGPLSDHPAALALADIALWDIVGKYAGLPIYKLLGGFRTRMRICNTVGIIPVRETVEKAESFAADGFKLLKIKGGINPDEDIERVLKVRERVGSEIDLVFDANQGYSETEALRFTSAVEDARLAIFEQPNPADRWDELARISQKSAIPVMADESVVGMADAMRLVRNRSADMVNIKLMKAGGICEALTMNTLIGAAGIPAMIGCMDESGLGIAAGLHVALACPNVVIADLDGHLRLADDPAAHAMILENGTLFPNDAPGLGVDLNDLW